MTIKYESALKTFCSKSDDNPEAIVEKEISNKEDADNIIHSINNLQIESGSGSNELSSDLSVNISSQSDEKS